MKTTTVTLVGGAILLVLSCLILAGNFGAIIGGERDSEPKSSGRELFTREWLPRDRRSHAGDGLGPVFNARSCFACHYLGGVGGAGPRHINVRIVSVFLEHDSKQPDRCELTSIHPALRTENSFPFHRFGTEKGFSKWKIGLSGNAEDDLDPEHGDAEVEAIENSVEIANAIESPNGSASISREVGDSKIQLLFSERNTPSLFGVGLIDRIPDRVLEEAALSQSGAVKKATPVGPRSEIREKSLSPRNFRLPVSGRVARLRDGRIGRFGWKAQTASLRDFTLQACARELGLEVPGFSQAAPPWDPGYKAPGLDLTKEQCDSLIDFVASIPPPRRQRPETEQHAAEITAGQKLFSRMGCVVCHRPKLGDVEGIYSDLLLHDMGPKLADSGEYGGSHVLTADGPSDKVDPLPILTKSDTDAQVKKTPKFGAGPREWRTPPLWGLRYSAPYLHDGRADTISAAIAFHGGEGDDSASEYLRLSLHERQQVELFLQSLSIPER